MSTWWYLGLMVYTLVHDLMSDNDNEVKKCIIVINNNNNNIFIGSNITRLILAILTLTKNCLSCKGRDNQTIVMPPPPPVKPSFHLYFFSLRPVTFIEYAN